MGADVAATVPAKWRENRSWKTKHRGPLLIHASQRPVPTLDVVRKDVLCQFGIQIPDDLQFGGIVGQVNVVACVPESDSPWFWGQVGFVCEDATHLPFVPMSASGDCGRSCPASTHDSFTWIMWSGVGRSCSRRSARATSKASSRSGNTGGITATAAPRPGGRSEIRSTHRWPAGAVRRP
jgi:hypothetical protein